VEHYIQILKNYFSMIHFILVSQEAYISRATRLWARQLKNYAQIPGTVSKLLFLTVSRYGL